MLRSKECALICPKSGQAISLEHGKTFDIGRGRLTEIIDTKVSKRQVSVVADFEKHVVVAKCNGGNPSGVNNKKLKNNDTITLHHGDQLELLLGKFIYKVVFTPSPSYTDNIVKNNNEKPNTNGKHINENNDTGGNPVKKLKMTENTEDDHVCTQSKWEDVDNGKLLIYTKEGTKNSSKIAAYDLDGTIILTKSGKVFPQHRDDWMLANSEVKPSLLNLIDNGYKVIIFTNQAGISRGKTNVTDFKYKTEKIVESLGIPVQVFVATADDIYRKPAPGMWNALVDKKNSGLTIDMDESFYVGDAAGRVLNWMPKKKKDFSTADRLFALNIGLKFHTPEAHFLKQPEGEFKLPDFNPMNLDINAPISNSDIIANSKEVIIMVGSPGSGKSFFVTTYLIPAGYSHVNRDTLKTWQKCVVQMENALQAGKSVVIDNTNPDKVSRKRFVDVAAKMNIPCRCFILNLTLDHAKHNNKFRQLVKDEHVLVNEIMINSYNKKYEPPTKEEGFTEIVHINFVPKFQDPEREKLYKMFLV